MHQTDKEIEAEDDFTPEFCQIWGLIGSYRIGAQKIHGDFADLKQLGDFINSTAFYRDTWPGSTAKPTKLAEMQKAQSSRPKRCHRPSRKPRT